ncbi:MAG: GNAT family N-acetyltransferase [Gammaproteobacteria bacterium]|nr:GNAT family N-acetyltransferase [Gammaproteobacteria bacterium]MDH3372236.1 GNAT family N-acetyltransferase [Gammaproteobacteria bacterium]MDH3408913.1 GNAT family N-acetyltransferase [Gammaproteobacteria bacterium]MDH3552056.1 GNAT family N-acetyltransferase [Gammaproteobacteria bacterium]
MRTTQVTVNASIANIASDEWNRLVGDEYPFLRHEFLLAAERSGSVSAETGWHPCHLSMRGRDGKLRAALPLYKKDHSWGEFVFDWAWARAYEQAGLAYYPKLVSAVPFTPAPSRRLLLREATDTEAASRLLQAAITLADESGCSSLHVLFPEAGDLDLLRDAGLRTRKDCQFHWHNDGYVDFDDFLAAFSSAKRKKTRRDRRRVIEAGITFRRLHGGEIDVATWDTVYRLISLTFMRRGSMPYFGLEFFIEISRSLPDNILVILAERENQPIAAAVFFESQRVLYGRYWGSNGHYDALHFETCYYQGIDYCIDTKKQLFEPGTQGEHKISRGFEPVPTWSAHWLRHPEFFAAIGNYLDEERRHIERYMDAVDGRSPYRNDRNRSNDPVISATRSRNRE